MAYRGEFGRAVKTCMTKVFTEDELKTCSVRGKKSKDGTQRKCLRQDKLCAIIGKNYYVDEPLQSLESTLRNFGKQQPFEEKMERN